MVTATGFGNNFLVFEVYFWLIMGYMSPLVYMFLLGDTLKP